MHGRGISVRQPANPDFVSLEDLLAPVAHTRHQAAGLGVDRDDHAPLGGDDLASAPGGQGHDPVAGRVSGPPGHDELGP